MLKNEIEIVCYPFRDFFFFSRYSSDSKVSVAGNSIIVLFFFALI